MTMAFAVEDSAQLRGLERGDRVRFTFTQSGAGPSIASITEVDQ